MNNPLSMKARGVLYVASIIVSGLTLAIGPLLIALDQPIVAMAIVGGSSSLALVAGSLARDNLTSPSVQEDDPNG